VRHMQRTAEKAWLAPGGQRGARASAGPCFQTSSPATPSGSWFTATTSRAVSSPSVKLSISLRAPGRAAGPRQAPTLSQAAPARIQRGFAGRAKEGRARAAGPRRR